VAALRAEEVHYFTMDQCQNLFNDDIITKARERGMPPLLYKTLIAQESQFILYLLDALDEKGWLNGWIDMSPYLTAICRSGDEEVYGVLGFLEEGGKP